jgi:hypothetical protein
MIYRNHMDSRKNSMLRVAELRIRQGEPAETTGNFLAKYSNFSPDGRFMPGTGFLLIGSVQSQETRLPTLGKQHYDTDLKAWVLDSDPHSGPSLYGTNVGGIAVLSALFGDLNEHNERKRLGIPLTDADRPHFGWELTHPDHDSIFTYYALAELISSARKLGHELQGSIDVVDWPQLDPYQVVAPMSDAEYQPPPTPSMRARQERTLPPGIHHASYAFNDAITYMSIPVNGTDLPPTIRPLLLPDNC